MRVINFVFVMLEILSVLLLFALTGGVLIGVADRFILHYGWPWPEELARFILVWLTFLTAAIAARFGHHFVIDFFVVRLFKQKGAIIQRISASALVCGILMIIFLKGLELTLIVIPQTSTALGISMGWVYGVIPVGALFTILFFIAGTLEFVRKAGNQSKE